MKEINQHCKQNLGRGIIYGLLGVVAAIFLSATMFQRLPAYAVSNNEIAQDGEYDATLIATKNKDNKRYYATIYVEVEDGVISNISISASEKQKDFNKYVYPQIMEYVGKTASVSSIPDAVSSASTSGSAKYSVNLNEAIRSALSKAPAVQKEEEKEDTPDSVAAAGTYTGTAVMNNGHYITVEVRVDNAGKISDLSIKDADGNWDNLFGTVKGSYIGVYADRATGGNGAIDAVTSATSNGYRQAIADAIKNALTGNSPAIPDQGDEVGQGSKDNQGSQDSKGNQDNQENKENVVYPSETVETVSDKTFTGVVTVNKNAVITFENCRFPYGIKLEDESATAIVKNCYFGTEGFYIPVSTNEVGEFKEDTVISQESGVAALFPDGRRPLRRRRR